MANLIQLRKGQKIGQPDAESDDEFLRACFLNNGNYDQAESIGSKQCILLGRTGSGKSAILTELSRRRTNVIQLDPEMLSLQNLADSNLIGFFEESGVHLDAFYVLLWKHIFSVELLRRKYKITGEQDERRFLQAMAEICRKDRSKELAVNYLRSWGDKFWIETEYRTSDFTRKLEQRLEGGLTLEHVPVGFSAKAARGLTEEQKIQVLEHGRKAVAEVQIRELAKVIDLLAEDIFPENGEPYYICIDHLDEDWVQDDVRFKLLKAMIETIRAFQKIRSVKIIVTARTDLMYSLFQRVNNLGFQSEKYTGYYLPLKWTRAELAELLNRRVAHLFEYQYSGRQEVGLHDILPVHINGKVKSIDYILDRTFLRPREAISFLNKCIEKSEGLARIEPAGIRDAERIYSEERLIALCDEWRREYPLLRTLSGLMRDFSDGSEVASMRNKKLETFCLILSRNLTSSETALAEFADDAASDAQEGGLPFLSQVLSIFYRVGLVGLKTSPTTAKTFSYIDDVYIAPEQIHLLSRVYVHPTFWDTLAIRRNGIAR